MLLNAYLLINCDCKSPQRALQGFFFFFRTQYSRQDGDDDGASQYIERKCFSNKFVQ